MADWLARIGRVGGSTGAGALSGAALGPWGAAGGAALGLIGGLFSDSAANDADIANEGVARQNSESAARNRAAIEALMGSIQGQANPFSDPSILGAQYNQIGRGFAGAQQNALANLASRGMAGQGQGDALLANLDAARANAVTGAQANNAAQSASWQQNRNSQLMQLQGLAQQGDQAALNSALQMAQMGSQRAQEASAGLNSTVGGLAQFGSKNAQSGAWDGVQKFDWGGLVNNLAPRLPERRTVQPLNGPWAPRPEARAAFADVMTGYPGHKTGFRSLGGY